MTTPLFHAWKSFRGPQKHPRNPPKKQKQIHEPHFRPQKQRNRRQNRPTLFWQTEWRCPSKMGSELVGHLVICTCSASSSRGRCATRKGFWGCSGPAERSDFSGDLGQANQKESILEEPGKSWPATETAKMQDVLCPSHEHQGLKRIPTPHKTWSHLTRFAFGASIPMFFSSSPQVLGSLRSVKVEASP